MTAVTQPPAPAQPPPLRRNISFQMLWIGSLASTLGTTMSTLAYPLLTLAITDSPAKAGLVGAVQLAGIVIGGVPAGPLVDRWDRRRILIGCDAVRAAGVASVAAVVLIDRATLTHLLLVALVQGGATALFNPARLATVRAVVPGPQLPAALAQDEARTYASSLAGPPLGGVLFGVGRAIPFLFDAVSYLVSLACVVAARVPRRPDPGGGAPGAGTPSMAGQLRDGLRWVWGNRLIRAASGFSLVINLAIGGMLVPVIVLVTDRGATPVMVGVVMGAMGVGGLLGAALAARLSILAPRRLVLAGTMLLAVLFPALTLPFGVLWPAAILALIMFVPPALTVTIQATVLSETPEDMQGRVAALMMITSLAIAPAAPMVTGLTTEAVGPSVTLIGVGVFLAIIACAATLSPGGPPVRRSHAGIAV